MKKTYIAGIVAAVVLMFLLGLIFMPKHREIGSQDNSGNTYLKLAEAELAQNSLLKAKELYLKAMEEAEDAGRLDKIRHKIDEISIRVMFSPLMDECSTEYVVKPRDALSKIARKFNTTVGLIKRANNLTSDTIRLEQKLKINTCRFSIVVDKSQNLLFLKRKDEVIKTYVVSTGKDNSTPAGTFKIDKNKLKNPTWFKTGAIIPPDSPENILGSRWMGIEGFDNSGEKIKGYGIHGTTAPNNLGRQATLGCIRMKNAEVEELFDIIPVGTEVVIVD